MVGDVGSRPDGQRDGRVLGEQREYFVGDVAFEAADGVAVGEAFGGASGDACHGSGFLVTFAQQHDAVQGGGGLPVTTAREAEALPCSGGRRYGRDAAEGGELSLGSHAIWIVSGSGEQVRGNKRADTACGRESRVLATGKQSELVIDMGNVCRQRVVALRERDCKFVAVKATIILPDGLGRADQQTVDLIDARGAGFGG